MEYVKGIHERIKEFKRQILGEGGGEVKSLYLDPSQFYDLMCQREMGIMIVTDAAVMAG